MNLTGGMQPERAHALRISTGLLSLLRIAPALGRGFLPDEIWPGKDHVVLLTEGIWKRNFASDPGVLGKTVKLNDENYVVVGVLPAAFQFPPTNPSDIVLPQPPDPNRGHGFVNVVGRLKPGARYAQAQAELDTISARVEAQHPRENGGAGVRVLSLHESYVSNLRPALLIFLSAVGFVLLIACANVANLFLGRTAGRQREMVMRAAMGAGRLRLVRQLLTEGALMGLAGGAMGLLIAFASMRGLEVLMRRNFPTLSVQQISLDTPVLLFTVVISLVVGLASGLMPALAASRLDLNDTLKESSRGLTGNRRRYRVRGALVVAEIALALVLLIGAGLMLKSFVLLENVNPGIQPQNILALNLGMSGKKYAKTEARAPFVEEMVARVEQIPGVQSAAVVTDVPLTSDNDNEAFQIEGQPYPGPKNRPIISVNVVVHGYLRTLGIPLLRGRDLSQRDNLASPTVVLVNQAMAHKYFDGQDPIGTRISADGKNWLTITGVVGDVRQQGLKAEPQPEVYLSYLQDPFEWPYLTLLVRTAGDPIKMTPTIESVVWAVDKDVPIPSVQTMEQIRSASIAQPRVTTLLLGVFAGLALVLAAIGIYGVMAYSVTQRTHEMGLRMALGAARTDVLKLVLGQGLLLAMIGLALGLGGAFALTRLLAKLLWNVHPTDPLTFAGVSALLTAVALLACYVPARRATKVDPMVALRYE